MRDHGAIVLAPICLTLPDTGSSTAAAATAFQEYNGALDSSELHQYTKLQLKDKQEKDPYERQR